MTIKPIPSIPGAFANDEGKIKLPEGKAKMPNGGVRTYETIWILGSRRRASKTARHEYYGVLHRGKNYKVHRLVCEAFHGPAPEGKNIVLHLDEDATNNKPCNLRWGTQRKTLICLNSSSIAKEERGAITRISKVRSGKVKHKKDPQVGEACGSVWENLGNRLARRMLAV